MCVCHSTRPIGCIQFGPCAFVPAEKGGPSRAEIETATGVVPVRHGKFGACPKTYQKGCPQDKDTPITHERKFILPPFKTIRQVGLFPFFFFGGGPDKLGVLRGNRGKTAKIYGLIKERCGQVIVLFLGKMGRGPDGREG